MATFKSYSEKSKARRALIQVHKRDDADDYLIQKDGKWGFHMEGGFPVIEDVFELQPAETVTEVEPVAVRQPQTEPLVITEPILEPVVEILEEETAPSAFGSFCFGQLTASTNGRHVEPEATEPTVRSSVSTKGHKIEKDRAIQNGVQIPSIGTVCRTVWDTLTTMVAANVEAGSDAVPTAKDIKAVAIAQGWNLNNASIEYYRWRKFNGIVGHGKKTV